MGEIRRLLGFCGLECLMALYINKASIEIYLDGASEFG
jgi:hypothetical protein